MKTLLSILFLLTSFSVYAQSWEIIPSTNVQMIALPGNAPLNYQKMGFKRESKIIVIQNSSKDDFVSLFQHDKSAFDSIYNGSGRILAEIFFDSTEIETMGIQKDEKVVYLHSRKSKKNGTGVVWLFTNPYKDGRPCSVKVNLRQKQKNQGKIMHIVNLWKVCDL